MREQVKDIDLLKHIRDISKVLMEWEQQYSFDQVHGYYAINPHQLWQVIEQDIPTIQPIIENYITELE